MQQPLRDKFYEMTAGYNNDDNSSGHSNPLVPKPQVDLDRSTHSEIVKSKARTYKKGKMEYNRYEEDDNLADLEGFGPEFKDREELK